MYGTTFPSYHGNANMTKSLSQCRSIIDGSGYISGADLSGIDRMSTYKAHASILSQEGEAINCNNTTLA
jgi:hypothetical protein